MKVAIIESRDRYEFEVKIQTLLDEVGSKGKINSIDYNTTTVIEHGTRNSSIITSRSAIILYTLE